MEETLKKSTIGLVRLEDFTAQRKALEEAKAREAARTNELKYVEGPVFLVYMVQFERSLTGCGEFV